MLIITFYTYHLKLYSQLAQMSMNKYKLIVQTLICTFSGSIGHRELYSYTHHIASVRERVMDVSKTGFYSFLMIIILLETKICKILLLIMWLYNSFYIAIIILFQVSLSLYSCMHAKFVASVTIKVIEPISCFYALKCRQYTISTKTTR